MKRVKKTRERAEGRHLIYLILRYTTALLLGLFISLFYKIFTPLTLKTLYLFLSMASTSIVLHGSIFSINGFTVNIIPACVSGSAYYLLVVLNMLTPMGIIKRISFLISNLFLFFIFNILRILFLIYLLIVHTPISLYNTIHKFLWIFVSTILVLSIWLLSMKLFNVDKIPLSSDIHYILSKLVKRKNKKVKEMSR